MTTTTTPTWTTENRDEIDLVVNNRWHLPFVAYEVTAGHGATAVTLLAKADVARYRNRYTDEARRMADLYALPGFAMAATSDDDGEPFTPETYPVQGRLAV